MVLTHTLALCMVRRVRPMVLEAKDVVDAGVEILRGLANAYSIGPTPMTRAVLIATPPRELQGKKSSLTRNRFLVPINNTVTGGRHQKSWTALVSALTLLSKGSP